MTTLIPQTPPPHSVERGTTTAPQPRRRPSRLRRSWEKYWYAWAMVAPVVVIFLVLNLYPFARGVFLSFTNLTEANQLTERWPWRPLGAKISAEESPPLVPRGSDSSAAFDHV